MDVNTIYQVSHLDAWQGSMGTGAGYFDLPRQKKQSEEDDDNPDKKKQGGEGITQDSSGIVHIDLIA